MGAVYSTVACYALALLLLGSVVARKLAPLSWPWRDFLKVAGACSAMAIAVRMAPSTGGMTELLLKASVGATIYVMTALVLDAAGARAMQLATIHLAPCASRLTHTAPAR
jgi:hypothetical protein